LEKSGQRDNTIIVFTSDHGLACGQHGLMGKQNMFEHSMKPPLLFVGPKIPRNKKIDTPIYMQDLVPTTLELAGLEIPDEMEFDTLLPLIFGKEKSLHGAIYGAYKNSQRMVIKDGMKLVWYPEAEKHLLFDLAKDPDEINDLSDDLKRSETLLKLKTELSKLQKEFRDPLIMGQ
jgi:arylsulfatase A-like enzyme